MKKSSLTTLIIAVIAIIIIFFIFRPETSHSPITTLGANWTTFHDPISGSSFDAPKDFTEIPANSGYILQIATTTPYFNTHLINEAYIKIDAPSAVCVESDLVPKSTSTSVTIAGQTFTRVETSDVGAGQLYRCIEYTTTRGGNCYKISLFTHSTNGEGFYSNNAAQIAQVDAAHAADMAHIFGLFDQIVATVRFDK